jgi:hypothetical protein
MMMSTYDDSARVCFHHRGRGGKGQCRGQMIRKKKNDANHWIPVLKPKQETPVCLCARSQKVLQSLA